MTLVEQFAGKRQLEEKINETRIALGDYRTLDNLQLAAEGKRRYVDTLKKEISDKSSNVRVYAGDIDLAETEANEAETIFNDALAKKKQLTDELKTLEAQLATVAVVQVGKADLLKIQGEKEALLAQIEKIQAAIATETANEKPYLVEPDHPLSLLMEQRNAILADIAIGEVVDQAELDAVQEKIKGHEARLSEAIDSSIVQANTTEGLKRKLSDCEEQLIIAEQLHKDAFFHYLSKEMESAGRKYAALALEFGDLFTWIAAASDLLKKCGTPKTVLDLGSSGFRIPTLLLDGCTIPGPGYAAKNLFSYEQVNRHAAVLDIVEWLGKMGIEPPVAAR